MGRCEVSYRCGKAGSVLVALVLVAACASYAHAVAVPRETWLNITAFNFTAHRSPGNDVFVLKGSFNLAPNIVGPTDTDITLTIGTGATPLTSDLWRQVGKSNKYKAKLDNVSMQIDYWVAGTSRCNFIVIGSKQDLPSIMDYPSETTIGLQVGAALNETLLVVMVLHSTPNTIAAKLGGCIYNEGPTFLPDSIRITRNHKKANADSITIVARIWESDFLSDVNDITISAGTFSATIPAGSIKVPGKSRTAIFRGDLPTGGKASVTFADTGKFTVTISGVDLSSVVDPDAIQFMMVGLPESRWYYRFYFKTNEAYTSSKY